MSTGIISDFKSPLQSIERITPLAAPIITPVGPFKLSTQPGFGSCTAGVTRDQYKFIVEKQHSLNLRNNTKVIE